MMTIFLRAPAMFVAGAVCQTLTVDGRSVIEPIHCIFSVSNFRLRSAGAKTDGASTSAMKVPSRGAAL